MLLHLHRCRSGFTLLLATVALSASAEETAGPVSPDWDAFLEETETATDLLSDTGDDQVSLGREPTSLLFIASLRAGPGHSNNFLKRPAPVKSLFTHIEGDAYLSWYLKRSVITGLVFAELNLYEEDFEASDEYLGLAQLTWRFPAEPLDVGLKLESIIADQIYDASLTTLSDPEGTRIQQTIPEASLFIEGYFGNRNRLYLEGAIARAIFDFEGEDYWEPSFATEWEHLWLPSLTSITKLKVARQLYDDDVGRTSNGNPLTDAGPLVVDRFKLDGSLTWKPQAWKWLQANLALGITWDKDQSGEYENRRRSWISLGPRFSNRWGHLQITGRWSETRYDTRYSEYFDPTPDLQTQRSLRTELKGNLPWNFELLLRGEWTRFDARSNDDAYSETRAEALLGWNY